MNDINNRKFIAAGLLFALWTVLVCVGHADKDLIDAIKWTLSALGAFHAVSNLQAAAAAPVSPPQLPSPPAQIPLEVIVAQVAAALAQHQSTPQAPQPPVSFPPAPKEPA